MITCTFENGNVAAPGLRHCVADVLVLKGERILMAKRAAGMLEGGKWALIGGYADRDETLPQTAEREVREETGWSVKDLQLLRINDNPNRPHEALSGIFKAAV